VAAGARVRRLWLGLGHDIAAGRLLIALLVPAGMGYATPAALPPQAGLFASVAALLAYTALGPSRVLVLGPDSSLAPLIAEAVVSLAAVGAARQERRVVLVGLPALLVAVILLVAGLLRLGIVAAVLSKLIRIGYLNGVAFVVVVGQLPALLGFTCRSNGGIADGPTRLAAVAIGTTAPALILAFRRVAPRAPGCWSRWPAPSEWCGASD
jgi:MFS superfamily sulfate permease-like transporter